MSPERSEKSKLEEALAKLERSFKERQNERSYRELETPTGFTGSIEFYKDGTRNLRLEQGGQRSLFVVSPDGVRFMELRGVDDELLDEPRMVEQHSKAAWDLFDQGQLEQFKADENGQFEMDI